MLLEMIGLPHEVIPPTLEEDIFVCDDPPERVLTLAREKANRVRDGVKEGVILGADTLVVHNGWILEKPRSRADAVRMLTTLANEWHEVYTGLHLIDTGTDSSRRGYEVTRVRFRDLDRDEIDVYLDTGEPMDKAGSYGIQGFGAVFIERVEGCYFNVVGLPLYKLILLLSELGYCFDFKRLRRK